MKKLLISACIALAVAAFAVPATAVNSSAAQVTLAWDANDPVPDGYCVYSRKDNDIYNFDLPAWQGTGTTCTISDLEENTAYFFVVRARVGSEYSGNSNEVTFKPANENQKPIANAGTNQTVTAGQAVRLDGAASMDPDGSITGYAWRQTSGTSVTLSGAASVRAEFTAPDATQSTQLAFTLTVTDNGGLTASDTCTVTVEPSVPSNRPPVAEAGPNQTVAAGSPVTLDGSHSSDPENQQLTYSWTLKAGPQISLNNATTATPFFTAPQDITESLPLTFELSVSDPLGLSSSDTCIVLVEPLQNQDSDGDGVVDSEDAFPDDKTEWKDSDGDGTGDNADPDDDNDLMPDEWEIRHGLDPYTDDANKDPDNDGISNLEEYRGGTDPQVGNGNTPPDKPVMTSPSDGAIDLPLRLQLRATPFSDQDSGDMHAKTQWQVVDDATGRVMMDITVSKRHLTGLRIPRLVLAPSRTYRGRLRYYDDHGAPSEWSADITFTTESNHKDKNENGIPDIQEVDSGTDVNRDGIADQQQETIVKSVQTPDGRRQLAVSIQSNATGTNIVSAEQFDTTDLENPPVNEKQTPYGLLGFKIAVEKPGSTAKVRLFFSERLDAKTQWVRYHEVQGWETCPDCLELIGDGYGAAYELQDGQANDADGTANGIIIDLAGPRMASTDDGGMTDPDGSSGDSGPSVGSCFIHMLLQR